MKQAIAVVVAALAVVVGAVVVISRVADVSDLDKPASKPDKAATEKSATEDWEKEAIAAFGGADLSTSVFDMVDGAREWLDGARPTEQFTAELDRYRNQMGDVTDRVRKLRQFPYDKRVNSLYRDAADLYLQTVVVYQAMVQQPAGDVRTQHDLLARRIRILADRVFDRGRELLKPTLHETVNPDVDIRLPEEVPNWVQEGVAPGPPIEDPPPASSGEPTLREKTRPEQPRDDWLRAVKSLDLSDKGDPKLNARALVDGAERLRAVADPVGDREEGARIRLSLLVDADSYRAAQLQLADVSKALAAVADHLWEAPGLPKR